MQSHRFGSRLWSALFFVGFSGMGTVVGCATESTKPDAMSAEQHRSVATEHRKKAAETERSAAQSSSESRFAGTPINTAREFTAIDDVSWGASDYRWEVAKEERNLAAEHEDAAMALENFEDANCKKIPKETRGKCPLLGTVASVTDVESGVHLALKKGFPRAAVFAHIKCHLAFARKAHREGMSACPLYLDHVAVKVDGDGLELSTESSNLKELRKRSHTHISSHEGS